MMQKSNTDRKSDVKYQYKKTAYEMKQLERNQSGMYNNENINPYV